MENKEIICIVDMFGIGQRVCFPDGKEERIKVADLSSYLPSACSDENIFKIHMYGNNQYIDGIINEIKQNELIKFNRNIIEIEVN